MQNQLSFEKLYNPPKPAGPVPNVTVGEDTGRRIKPQAAEILQILRFRPVQTRELVLIASQYGARIQEIRKHLQKKGFTVDCFEGDDGNNYYKIVPFHGSKYQAKLMARQKVKQGKFE
jgi:hypothetical protein